MRKYTVEDIQAVYTREFGGPHIKHQTGDAYNTLCGLGIPLSTEAIEPQYIKQCDICNIACAALEWCEEERPRTWEMLLVGVNEQLCNLDTEGNSLSRMEDDEDFSALIEGVYYGFAISYWRQLQEEKENR